MNWCFDRLKLVAYTPAFLGIFFLLVITIVPSFAHAQAGLTVCGVTGGDLYSSFSCQFCSLFQLADKLIHYLILIAPVLAAVLFSYAGFLYMTAGGSVHGTEKAREIFTDVVVGMIIILCSFLVVDTLLRSIASGKLATPSWAAFQCTDSATRLKTINGPGGLANGQPLSAVNPQGTDKTTAVPPYKADIIAGMCNPSAMPDPTDGSWSQQQRQVLSCIATNESGCQFDAKNNDKPDNSATGYLQVLVGYNNNGMGDQGHDLNFPSCSSAAGVNSNLNCSKAFKGATVVDRSLFNTCIAAAKNPQCNIDASNWLVQANCKSGDCYSAWRSGDVNNRNTQCIQKYGG